MEILYGKQNRLKGKISQLINIKTIVHYYLCLIKSFIFSMTVSMISNMWGKLSVFLCVDASVIFVSIQNIR